MAIKATIPASDLLKLQPSKKIVKSALGSMLKITEKYFGSSVLMEVPHFLQGIDPEILPAIEIASRLKSLGMIRDIRKIPKVPDEPFLFRYTTSPAVDAWGSDFLSEESAIWKALGETIERTLWRSSRNFYHKKIINVRYERVKKESIDIFSLSGFSIEQRKRNKALMFDEKTQFDWLKVDSLVSDREIFCPAQLLSARYYSENAKTLECETKKEPMLRWPVTTGLATGQSLEEATVKGILEVIERDAFMITYLNKLSPSEIKLEDLFEQDGDIQKVLLSLKRYNLEPHILLLPTDFSVPVVFSLLIDRSGLGPALTVGASADYDVKAAILDALAESLSVRLGIKDIFKKETKLGKMGRRERTIHWADPARLPKIGFLFQGKKIKLPTLNDQEFFIKSPDKKERRDYYQKQLKNIVGQFKSKNYELVLVDITTKEIESMGLHCVYVLSPELQPLHLDESLPYLGGKRLREVPLKLGYQPSKELNREPHPFP